MVARGLQPSSFGRWVRREDSGASRDPRAPTPLDFIEVAVPQAQPGLVYEIVTSAAWRLRFSSGAPVAEVVALVRALEAP